MSDNLDRARRLLIGNSGLPSEYELRVAAVHAAIASADAVGRLADAVQHLAERRA